MTKQCYIYGLGIMEKSSEKQEKEKDIKALLESKSGREGIRIEKEQATVGNVNDYTITNTNGAQTNVKVNNETNAVEVKGEEKNAVQSSLEGNGDFNKKTNNDLSKIQQEAISAINSSDLSQEEKAKAISEVSSHNFSKDEKKTAGQYLQEVKAKLQEKERKEEQDTKQQEQGKKKEPNPMEKALGDLSKAPLILQPINPQVFKSKMMKGIGSK